MAFQTNSSNELYNLRWNSYFTNLTNVFADHQNHETLVDVTVGCEGQFIKAHKLVLSACSSYFQKVFQNHTAPQLLILLNDVKFEHLRLVMQFMYRGEVKVADAEMQNFLQLGKMLQVKGLCSVELQDKQKQNTETKPEKSTSIEKTTESKKVDTKTESKKVETKTENNKPETKTEVKVKKIDNKTPEVKKTVAVIKSIEKKVTNEKEPFTPVLKKRKLSPTPVETKKKSSPPPLPETKDISHIPRPPNAFMIFANQWRKKLAVEYPNESNKDISVRLGNMWKSLSPETRDAFYEDARKADEDHKLKYPGYYYSPKEARHRKAIANITKTVPKVDSMEITSPEFIEIKCEDDDDREYGMTTSNGS